jgi:hypothetical protein
VLLGGGAALGRVLGGGCEGQQQQNRSEEDDEDGDIERLADVCRHGGSPVGPIPKRIRIGSGG